MWFSSSRKSVRDQWGAQHHDSVCCYSYRNATMGSPLWRAVREYSRREMRQRRTKRDRDIRDRIAGLDAVKKRGDQACQSERRRRRTTTPMHVSCNPIFATNFRTSDGCAPSATRTRFLSSLFTEQDITRVNATAASRMRRPPNPQELDIETRVAQRRANILPWT